MGVLAVAAYLAVVAIVTAVPLGHVAHYHRKDRS